MSAPSPLLNTLVSSYGIDPNGINQDQVEQTKNICTHTVTTKALFAELTGLAKTSALSSDKSKPDLEEQLVYFAGLGDIDTVQNLLKQLPVLSSSARGKAVIAAAKDGYIKIMIELLKSGSISEKHYGEAICASLSKQVPKGLRDYRHYDNTDLGVVKVGHDSNLSTPSHLHDAMVELLVNSLLYNNSSGQKRERGISQEHLDKAYLANALLPFAAPQTFLGAYWETNENTARGVITFELLAEIGNASPELNALIKGLIGKDPKEALIKAAKAIIGSNSAGYEAALEALRKDSNKDAQEEACKGIPTTILKSSKDIQNKPAATVYKPVINQDPTPDLSKTSTKPANTAIPKPNIKKIESGLFGTTVTYYPSVDALLTDENSTTTKQPTIRRSPYSAAPEELEKEQDIMVVALKALSTSIATIYAMGVVSAVFSLGILSTVTLTYGTVALASTAAAISLYSLTETTWEDVSKITDYSFYALPLIGFNAATNAIVNHGITSPITLTLAVTTLVSLSFSLGAFLYAAIYRDKELETEYDCQLMDYRVNLAKSILPSTAVIATTTAISVGYTLGAVSVITVSSGATAIIAAIASAILYLGTETTEKDLSEIIKITQIALPSLGAYCTLVSLVSKHALSPITGSLALVTLASSVLALAKLVFDLLNRNEETETSEETLKVNILNRMTKAVLASVSIGSAITAGVIAYTTGIASIFPICFGSVAAITAIASLILFIGTETREIDWKKITHNTLLFSGSFQFFAAYLGFFSQYIPHLTVPPIIITHLVITAVVTIVTNLALYGMIHYAFDLSAVDTQEKIQYKKNPLIEIAV